MLQFYVFEFSVYVAFLAVFIYVMVNNHMLYLDYDSLKGVDYDTHINRYLEINAGIARIDYV